jgi:putative heme-binding domain-containing protein
MVLVGGWLIFGGDPWGRAIANPPRRSHPSEIPFQVPPGLVAERVAGPPVVEYPIVAGFDDRGRLFVAHSAGRNVNFREEPNALPNSLRLLEDTQGVGRFDKFTVFADKMTFPTGALWYDGALYVCSPPYLWRMKDTKGRGQADVREPLVGKFAFWGHAGDIHGPFLGRDGRLYWTDGLVGHEIKRSDGTLVGPGQASRIYRCKPDGSDVEVVCGGGMDNPVMMTFTAEGEPLATSTLLAGYPARTDGIIYCIDGGVYPHHAHLIAEFPQTGDLLSPVVDLGHVSPSGLIRYRGRTLGAEYRDNLFVAEYNTHKVRRLILERDGATFRTRVEDFLVSGSEHFHPTDVLEDADGTLLVVDTGGWFRIGCLTGALEPQAKGGIYRIRRAGAPEVADPRGLALKWDRLSPQELTQLLDDPRWVVRDRSILLLAQRAAGAREALKGVLHGSPSVPARRNAVWALTRTEGREARALVRVALNDPDLSVRMSAAHAVGLHRDAEARGRLMEMVATGSPPERRQAATGLGRIRSAESVPALWAALRAGGDRFLEHALIYALIQIDDRPATLRGLHDPSPRVRRGALIALDQMEHGGLTQDLVTPLLDTDDPALQKTALEVLSRRGWAQLIAGLLRQWLSEPTVPPDRQESLRGAILALVKDPAIQGSVARALERDDLPVETRLLLMETIARAPLDKLPEAWVAEVARGLRDRDERVVRQAVATLRAGRVTEFDPVLLRLAQDRERSIALRVAALSAAVARLPNLDPGLFDFLRAQLDPERPPLVRLEAATALGSAPLEAAQLATLTDVLGDLGAFEMPRLLTAFERSSEPVVGRRLVTALERAPGLRNLTADALRQTFRTYPEGVRRSAEPLIRRLEVDDETMKSRLAELEPGLQGGDDRRGRELFFGNKAACATCHTIRSEGGKVGPDLSTIGAIRSGRDLLVAIVFPSAGFARGFEPYVVATRDGRVLPAGVVKRETADAIWLVAGDQAEVRVAKADIERIVPSRVSIMPQGLDAPLSRRELSDLIAFLRSLK